MDHPTRDPNPTPAIREALAAGDADRLDALLAALEPVDIADVLADLEPEQKAAIFERLGDEVAAEVLAEADEETRGNILDDASEPAVVAAIAEMPPDDAADVVAALTPDRRHDVLTSIPDEHASEVRGLLRYDEDSAGGIMTSHIAAVPDHLAAREAIRKTQDEIEGEEFYQLFVTGEAGRLVGVVPLHRLLFAPGDRPLREIMDTDVHSIALDADQEEAVRLIRRYDLPSLPVVDDRGILRGAIQFDDVMEVQREESDEDMYRMAGSAERDPTHEPTPRRFLLRMPWLMVTLAGGMLLASVAGSFEQSLTTITFAFFIPVVLGMAGNVGLQSATTIVRGLATGDVKPGRMATVLGRELQIGILLAVACGLIGGSLAAATSLLLGKPEAAAVGLIVGLSMSGAIVVASITSSVIPLSVYRLGADPAIASGPFVTLLNDLCGLTIYLVMVRLLSGTLIG